jgi:CRISPR-associated protein Cas6
VTVDLVFPATGTSIATDHAYHLYSALAGLVSKFHDADGSLRFASITGAGVSGGRLELGPHSQLTVRLPQDEIRIALPLAGKRLSIGDSWVRLGVPAVRTLVPAPALVARIVTFKNAEDPDAFLVTARAKLAELGVSGEPQLPIHIEGPRAGQPKRRVIRIKDVTITGYSLLVSELSSTDSVKLQECGLGGRTRIGCGFFTLAKEMR